MQFSTSFCFAALFVISRRSPIPREILVNSCSRNHIESFLRVSDVWVGTNIFHRWIHTKQKNAVSSSKRPLGEISMLVSACRKIVSATSAVLCGFLFALRTYLCERPSSSFRSFLLFLPLLQLCLPFLLLLPFLLFLLSLLLPVP